MSKQHTEPLKSLSSAKNTSKRGFSVFDILFGGSLSRARAIIISSVIARTF